MNIRGFALAIGALFVLGACTNLPFSKQDQGMVAGGIFGGIASSTVGGGSGRVLATIAGVLIGGYVGREVGGHMDREDAMRHERTVAETIVHGRQTSWRNRPARRAGGAEILQSYRTTNGYCREYREYVFVGEKEVSAYGTACQQPDGSWRIVN